MSNEKIAKLVLEWWKTGERTSERLSALVEHFARIYGLGETDRKYVREVLHCWYMRGDLTR
jgi:hypothetical protein